MSLSITTLTVPFVSGLLKKIGEHAGDKFISIVDNKTQKAKFYNSIFNEGSNKHYIENVIKRVFTFRTIVNGDKDVFLDQIYHPLKIKKEKRSDKSVKDGFTLSKSSPVCLVGVAGQGKTITMKKMFLEELNKTDFFPIFISFRDVDFSHKLSLVDVVKNYFLSYGLQCTDEIVRKFLKDISIRFYFDGFDEIPHNHRKNALEMLSECEYIWHCNVICSTRPDTEICKTPGFDVYCINYLSEDDVINIININISNESTRNGLYSLLKEKDFLQQSIKTPILVDIFIVTSVGLGKNPENVVSYYDSLFSSLVYKHDYNKVFTRKRKSSLTDSELEECLSYLFFYMHLKQKVLYEYNELKDTLNSAKNLVGKYLEDEQLILQDIIEITNLIITDGYNSYTVIHKSIQDFFAAKFITMGSDGSQKDFWTQALNMKPDTNFCYMMMCLSSRNYYSYYIAEKIKKCNIFRDDENIVYPTCSDVRSYMDSIFVNISSDFGEINGVSRKASGGHYAFDIIEDISTYLFIPKNMMVHPMTAVMLYCNKNIEVIRGLKDKIRIQKRSSKANINDTGFYFDVFLKEHPEADSIVLDCMESVRNLIDDILDKYKTNYNENVNKEEVTNELIKKFMQGGRRGGKNRID